MENHRTDTARRHDDSDMIDNIVPGASEQGRNGGNLQTDVATQVSQDRVEDPEATGGVTKSDELEYGTNVARDRPRAPDRG